MANAKSTALNAINAATTEAAVTATLNAFNTAIGNCTTQAAADLAAANAVSDAINALPDDAGLGDKAAVEAARRAYDKLTDAQKALVLADIVSKLTNAEAQVKAAEEETGEKIKISDCEITIKNQTAYGGGQRPLVRSRTAAVRSE